MSSSALFSLGWQKMNLGVLWMLEGALDKLWFCIFEAICYFKRYICFLCVDIFVDLGGFGSWICGRICSFIYFLEVEVPRTISLGFFLYICLKWNIAFNPVKISTKLNLEVILDVWSEHCMMPLDVSLKALQWGIYGVLAFCRVFLGFKISSYVCLLLHKVGRFYLFGF